MFAIKGRHYKIEYEDFHLICLICGCFGHYKDGCADQRGIQDTSVAEGVRKLLDDGSEPMVNVTKENGPWTIVHKVKNKGKESKWKVSGN